VAGVDVDVNDSVTGESILLCSDNSGATGVYQVRVPSGTYDVDFSPPFALPLAADVHPGTLVVGTTTLDGTLPPCPFSTGLGGGVAGTGGLVPALATSGGAPRRGNHGYALELSGGVGGGAAIVVIALDGEPNPALPLSRGGFVAHHDFSVSRAFSAALSGAAGATGAGAATVVVGIDSDASLVGRTLVARAWVRDNGAPGRVAVSNGIAATICD
jgi:hypothetical protein